MFLIESYHDFFSLKICFLRVKGKVEKNEHAVLVLCKTVKI